MSQFWADSDGCATQLSWDGSVVRSPPASFGAITNAHHIKLSEHGTVWDSSFESVFLPADSQNSELLEWVMRLESKYGVLDSGLCERFLGHHLPNERRGQLARCLASLIVRSPCFRHSIAMTVEYYRSRFGLHNHKADRAIIAANMDGCYEAFVKIMSRGGKFVILFTDGREFVFGDGFLHNFPPMRQPQIPDPICILPISPEVTIVFIKPMRYMSQPELMTFRLYDCEVEFFNETIQIYSKDYVFYRKDRPQILKAFANREFYEYEYHQHPWLSCFVDSILKVVPQREGPST